MYNRQYNRQPAWTEEHVQKFLPLVKKISGKLAMSLPSHIDDEDLIAYGVFGLLDALQKFEPSRGVKFETYASLRIRGSIIDGLRSMDWVPHSERQKVKKVNQVYVELENSLGRSPEMEEVAEKLGISLEELNSILLQSQFMTLVSLDEALATDSKDNNISALDMIIDHKSEESFEQIEKEEQKKILIEAIEKLSEKEKMVIALYYREDLTLKEIAAIMKLSESRISQIHSQAILRLRGYLSRQKKNIL